MKEIFLCIILLVSSLMANEPLINKKKVPLSIASPLLKGIEQHAFVIGKGPIKMYAFIDPLCPRSQDFVSMILESKRMQSLYTYCFFFYELKRFKTADLIATIYAQNRPLDMIKKIMYRHERVDLLEQAPENVRKKIREISLVAQKLDINKRPYLFIIKPEKGKY